jgi:thioredoxin 1
MDILDFVKELDGELTIVDFWAPWCGPCKVLHPILDNLQKNNPDIKIMKVNVDESGDLTKEFGVRNIPTLVFFKGEKEIERVSGAQQEATFQEIIDRIKD